jgi:hypothetical protein
MRWDWKDMISANLLHIGALLYAKDDQGRRFSVIDIFARIEEAG